MQRRKEIIEISKGKSKLNKKYWLTMKKECKTIIIFKNSII